MDPAQMLEMVRDPDFASLWRRCCRESVSWRQFRELPMPAGMDAGQAYAVVAALQHRAGTILPFETYMPEVTGSDNWFYETVEMHRLVREVVSECSAGSDLDRAIGALPARTRLTMRAGDFSAACERDGLEIDADAVRAVWSGARVPSSPAEALASNFPRAIGRISSFAGRRISAGAIEMLWETLTEGIDEPYGLARRYMVDVKKPSGLSSPDASLLAVAGLVDGDATAEINAVVRSFLAGGIFWDFDPFPWANSVAEVVVRSAMARREGLPVLEYLPLSEAFLGWELGRLPGQGGPFLEPVPDMGEGYDSTAHFTGKLRIAAAEIARLKGKVRLVEATEAAWREAIEGDGRFNARQRDVLLAALHDPGARFRVSDHERLHAVSHGTAHNDFVGLEDLGFLRRERSGRSVVFAATARLARLVGAV